MWNYFNQKLNELVINVVDSGQQGSLYQKMGTGICIGKKWSHLTKAKRWLYVSVIEGTKRIFETVSVNKVKSKNRYTYTKTRGRGPYFNFPTKHMF